MIWYVFYKSLHLKAALKLGNMMQAQKQNFKQKNIPENQRSGMFLICTVVNIFRYIFNFA